MKPRMKNHFRAHQLSIWLRLIPELHKAGMEDVIARHNLFKNHDDMDLYEGLVKPDSFAGRLNYLEDNLKRSRGMLTGGDLGHALHANGMFPNPTVATHHFTPPRPSLPSIPLLVSPALPFD